MIKNSTSLKEKINNIAKSKGISNQIILQNFMFERLLERISKSKYNKNFILKGGLLLSSIFGIDNRTTIDMNTSISNIEISEKNLKKIITEIINIDLDDDITINLIKFDNIKQFDKYNGYRCHLIMNFDGLKVNLNMDIATGDKITPRALSYKYKMMFEDKYILLQAYNNETILAEKFETIVSKGIGNSRMKDYYDFYILYSDEGNFNYKILKKAVINTFVNRDTSELLNNLEDIINSISISSLQKSFWSSYSKKFEFAKDIKFEQIVKMLTNFIAKM